jgi:hypothetical protein
MTTFAGLANRVQTQEGAPESTNKRTSWFFNQRT